MFAQALDQARVLEEPMPAPSMSLDAAQRDANVMARLPVGPDEASSATAPATTCAASDDKKELVGAIAHQAARAGSLRTSRSSVTDFNNAYKAVRKAACRVF